MTELKKQYEELTVEFKSLDILLSKGEELPTVEAFKDDAKKALKKAWEAVKKFGKKLYGYIKSLFKRIKKYFTTDYAKFGDPKEAEEDIESAVDMVRVSGMEGEFKKEVQKAVSPFRLDQIMYYKPITSNDPAGDFKVNARYIFNAIQALANSTGNGFDELKKSVPQDVSERAYKLFLNESVEGTYGGDQKDRVAAARDYVGFIMGRTIYIVYIGSYDFVYISSKTFKYDGVPEELALEFTEDLIKHTKEVLPKLGTAGTQYIEETLDFLDESYSTLMRIIERKDLLSLEYGKNQIELGNVLFKLIGWCEKDVMSVRIENRKLLRTIHKVVKKEPFNVSMVYQLLTATLANTSRAHGGVLRATARRLNIPNSLEAILLKVNNVYAVPYRQFFAETSRVKAVVYDNEDSRLKLYENETDNYIDYNQYLPLVAFDFKRKRWFLFRSVYDRQILVTHLKKRHR